MAFLKIFLCFLTCCLLPGCGMVDTSIALTGEILEYHTDAEGKLTALVIQTEAGNTVGLLPENDAEYGTVFWLDAKTPAEFQAEYPDTVIVHADCRYKKRSMTRHDGTEITAYTARGVMVTDRLEEREAYTFADGVTVDLWGNSFDSPSYRLSDGTVLLHVSRPRSPEDLYVGYGDNHATVRDLPDAVRDRVSAFYDEQGLLYDETASLELAYDFYRQNPGDFGPLMTGQDVSPLFSNEALFTIQTSVTLAVAPQQVQQIELHHTFDRNTGEQISNYDLFTVPPEELIDVLLALGNAENWGENKPDAAALKAALRPEYIAVSASHINVTYPAGTLPFTQYTYAFGFSYTPELWEILQPWARPAEIKFT